VEGIRLFRNLCDENDFAEEVGGEGGVARSPGVAAANVLCPPLILLRHRQLAGGVAANDRMP
jgi:hypothetical protein